MLQFSAAKKSKRSSPTFREVSSSGREGARANKIKVASVDRCCLKGNKFSSGIDERRERVQPCHTALALLRALAAEVCFSDRLCRTQLRRGMTSPRTSRYAYLSA